jgi:hypothetical protein
MFSGSHDSNLNKAVTTIVFTVSMIGSLFGFAGICSF